jgi:hypothetical protein
VSPIDGELPIGIPHRNAARGDDGDDGASADAEAATARVASVVEGSPALPALARAPLVRTRMDGPSKATSTVPSVSVRYVAPAAACSRSIVDGAGWPYGLPAPAETTATRGRTAARNGGVLDVREP